MIDLSKYKLPDGPGYYVSQDVGLTGCQEFVIDNGKGWLVIGLLTAGTETPPPVSIVRCPERCTVCNGGSDPDCFCNGTEAPTIADLFPAVSNA